MGTITPKDIFKNIIVSENNRTRSFNSVIMGDSDSSYVSLKRYMDRHNIDPSDEKEMIKLADQIQKKLENLVPLIFDPFFNVPDERKNILVPGREVVGKTGLFKPQKKRYAIHVIDDEGFAPKEGKDLKVVGIDVKRSDTPKFIQDFLKECLFMVVKNRATETELREYVDAFREKFRKMDPWDVGKPSTVSGITSLREKMVQYRARSGEKPDLFYARVAAINTNELISMSSDNTWRSIRDGDKASILYLLPGNQYGMEYVARPVDQPHVPDWFKALPIDQKKMETLLIDKKLEKIFGDSVGWDLSPKLFDDDEMVEELEW